MKALGNTLNRNLIASLGRLWEILKNSVLDRNRCRRGLGFGATTLTATVNRQCGLLPTFCDQRQSITTATLWSYSSASGRRDLFIRDC